MAKKSQLLLVCLLVVGSVWPSVASARVQRDVDYRYDQVWNAVVRLLRVDHRFPIEERDDAHGFVLFTFREYERSHTASIEVVRGTVDEGAPERVRLVLNIEGMPTHAEAALLDELEQKLRAEYGAPRRRSAVAQRGADPRMPRLADRPTEGSATPDSSRAPASAESPRREGETRDTSETQASSEAPSPDAQPRTDESTPTQAPNRRAARRR